MVKIAIVGTGYVGLVTGTCLAEVGHNVVCSDVSEEKITMLNIGQIPIYEPGLDEMVFSNVAANRLSFTTDVAGAIKDADVVFSAVGTPMGESYEADLTYVKQVAKTFAENLDGKFKVFVNKSTVPVGTADMVKEIVKDVAGKDAKFDVISNPEFLKEGAAVKDFMQPDRIVIGHETKEGKELMQSVYRPFERNQRQIFFTDVKSSELIKYASNAFLATKISFINEVANYCDIVGANVKDVAKGMGYDDRIGARFLHAGVGYGGSCFPKDVNALYKSGQDENYDFKIIGAVKDVNETQRHRVVDKLLEKMPDLKGKTVTIWGLTFKPKTDDVREAQSYYVIERLIEAGAIVHAHDPIGKDNFESFYEHLNVKYFEDKHDALDGSHALILMTEWDMYKVLDYDKKKKLMKNHLIIDGRNIYDPSEVKDKGFEYVGIGRQHKE